MTESSSDNLKQITQEFCKEPQNPPEDRIALIKELENFSENEIIDTLNYFLIIEKHPDVLIQILTMLANYNSPKSIDALTEILLWKQKDNIDKERYLSIRQSSAVLLGNIKDTKGVLPLLYVLNNKDENYKLRLKSAEALGRIGDKYAVAPLIDVVSDENEKSLYIRESAAKALGMLGDIRAVTPLVSILETKKGIIDKFTFLKERVIEALGRIGDKDMRTI
ncbi:MAG: HEAT repeat domain-containing protein, partial [Candidatus Gastranaerophilales bacterium]|nr:HEAT repeat domain-containing protein [Candidatus Gastranaerophilales bacterium]